MSTFNRGPQSLQSRSTVGGGVQPIQLGGTVGPGADDFDPLASVKFPGWYRDVDGGVCVIYKEHLVSIRYDKASGEYHVCADMLNQRGLWEKNVRWEATFDIRLAKDYALEMISTLATVGSL